LEPLTETRKDDEAGEDAEGYGGVISWGTMTWTTIEVVTVGLVMLFFGILVGSIL
jgi:hypothetical protein